MKSTDRRLEPKRLVTVEGVECALIPLTHGKYAIVDADLFDELNRWKWNGAMGYATRGVKQNGSHKTIRMHRVIAQTEDGLETDHINRNQFDNRRCNLRLATHSENKCNRDVYRTNRLGAKGIAFVKGRFRPRIQYAGKVFYFGSYATLNEAVQAHAARIAGIHGEFTFLPPRRKAALAAKRAANKANGGKA